MSHIAHQETQGLIADLKRYAFTQSSDFQVGRAPSIEIVKTLRPPAIEVNIQGDREILNMGKACLRLTVIRLGISPASYHFELSSKLEQIIDSIPSSVLSRMGKKRRRMIEHVITHNTGLVTESLESEYILEDDDPVGVITTSLYHRILAEGEELFVHEAPVAFRLSDDTVYPDASGPIEYEQIEDGSLQKATNIDFEFMQRVGVLGEDHIVTPYRDTLSQMRAVLRQLEAGQIDS